MSKLITYEIKFKRFVNGIWDNKFRVTTVKAENEFQAVWHLGTYNDDQNIEDVIVMVSSKDGNPTYFEVGKEYETLAGDKVKMVEFKDLEGYGRTNYETIMDENGHHRYSRRDLGRCTGSKSNDPGNIQLGVFWMRRDIDDPYDYIMERKYSDNGNGVKSNERVEETL
ncbi:hypothetical protein KNT70_gp083 [Cronobacter phage Pet-CM3-4]|jgi:hypothetical protein|uniref:Uncharacterized protein n=1 Tax=Cronobacter phage Pet-CM3-4 TaxID=1892569 RepID=A0A1D3RL58_9CAUD|nr:hypothetical protein KNT70_gp083 [Cronobacter phage Pet-CM3-4]SCN45776.1 hypothetical protein [Cronobacter phage Pet-CM3-4]